MRDFRIVEVVGLLVEGGERRIFNLVKVLRLLASGLVGGGGGGGGTSAEL